MNYCSNCGSRVGRRIPPGDDRPRFVCDICDAIHYQNPNMVVGIIPESEGRILLCRRAIEPRFGKWTFPAGYLENGETVSEAARRETLEEAGAEVEDLRPYAMFSLPHINQIYFIFLARVSNKTYGPGSESLEVKLYRPEDIPWSELAFAAIVEALRLYSEDRKSGVFSFRQGDIFPPRQGRKRELQNS